MGGTSETVNVGGAEYVTGTATWLSEKRPDARPISGGCGRSPDRPLPDERQGKRPLENARAALAWPEAGRTKISSQRLLTVIDRSCHADCMSDAMSVQNTDFQRLMASVGNLIFYWSLLEAELTDAIRRLRSDSGDVHATSRVRGSFNEQLAEWRALVGTKARRNEKLAEAVLALTNQIELLRHKRNLVKARTISSSSS